MKKPKTGFTIVEILIAVMIMSLTMVFVLRSFSQGFLYFMKSKDTTRMYKLAQRVVEVERSKTFSAVISVTTNWTKFDEPENMGFIYRIDRQSAGSPSNLQKIDFIIAGPYNVVNPSIAPSSWPPSWKTPRYREYKLTTYIARTPFKNRTISYRKKNPPGTGDQWIIIHKP